ncbi:hypothetical protein [Auraticoccus monumenti]|uniref:ABC-2 type transport system permease protein n=1 Tax=Auraticoccus monumenti TaxID=675864 RepID=A0A1G6SQS9_9ACTN|nr:hypothetical protein [Auraticoccus monumenti]SDD19193.1 ABC-2 type transport system permease protein [Auraticoccus monumenti]
MVAVLVRLKLALLRNALTRSIWKVLGLVFGGLYALGVIAAAYAGFVALRINDDPILTGGLTVLVFSLVTLGWVAFSVLISGIDDTLSPSRFALLPLSARRLQPGLFVAGLLGIPGVATTVVALGLVVAWSGSLVTALGALVAVPLGVATCFLLSRLATAGLAELLGTRRFRDIAVVLLALSGAGIGIGANVVTGSMGTDPTAWFGALERITDVLAWTPLGWAWALPASLAEGAWLAAAARLLLAVGLVVLTWWGWGRFLEVRLTSPLESRSGSGKVRSGGALDRFFGATPRGAVAARSLRYWRRDPRHLANLAALIVLPVLIVVTQFAQEEPNQLLVVFSPLLMALLLGSVISMELAYDGSAVALHVHTGLAGRDDRLGRLMAAGVLIVPALVVISVACVAIAGRWDLLVATLAMTLGVAVIIGGVASWISVFWPGHAPPPGANPFGKGSSGGLEAMVSFGVVTGASLVASLPVLAAGIGSLWLGWLQWVALGLALVLGALASWVGVVLGGRALDRRWPEVLRSVTALDA